MALSVLATSKKRAAPPPYLIHLRDRFRIIIIIIIINHLFVSNI